MRWPRFLKQQPTLVWCIYGRVGVDFNNDNSNKQDEDYNGDDHNVDNNDDNDDNDDNETTTTMRLQQQWYYKDHYTSFFDTAQYIDV